MLYYVITVIKVLYTFLFLFTTVHMLYYVITVIKVLYIQSVPGGMDKTSGECSLC